jgi:hypothetical protein
MHFGLFNALESFGLLMESLLRCLTYDARLIYLDVVVGRTFWEQPDNLRNVFHELRGVHRKQKRIANYFRRMHGTWDMHHLKK